MIVVVVVVVIIIIFTIAIIYWTITQCQALWSVGPKAAEEKDIV